MTKWMNRRTLVALSLCVLLSCLPSWSLGAEFISTPSTNQTITMSVTQYNELKWELTVLEQNLTKLEKLSTEDKSKLAELRTQLENCKAALMNAQTSLTSANKDLTELRTSLQTLRNEMESMEHKLMVKERQNKTWAALAGVALIGWCLK